MLRPGEEVLLVGGGVERWVGDERASGNFYQLFGL